MKRKHQKTLELIFSRPVSSNIKWRDIETLLEALGGEISEREGSRIGVRLFDERRVFHRPHPSPNTDKGAVSSYPAMVKRKRGDTMMNMMEINGYRSVITYDPEIEMFRGEFVGLNGGADFYASDIKSLKKEASISLKVFLDMCNEEDVKPRKEYSGKFNVRVPSSLHADIASAASADGKSLNQWIVEALDQAAHNGLLVNRGTNG